jgi:hypothetical protein
MGLMRLLSGTVAVLVVTVEAFSVLPRAPWLEVSSIRRCAPAAALTTLRQTVVVVPFRTARWNPLAFKPDESVDLYGGDDDKEEPEDPKPTTDSERLGVMATFLATRLSGAFLLTKVQQQQGKTTPPARSPEVAQVPKEGVATATKQPEAEESVREVRKTTSEAQMAEAKTETAWKAATEEEEAKENTTSFPVAEETLPVKEEEMEAAPTELVEGASVPVADEATPEIVPKEAASIPVNEEAPPERGEIEAPPTELKETATIPVSEESPPLETDTTIVAAPTESEKKTTLTEADTMEPAEELATVGVKSDSESLETASMAAIKGAELDTVESKAKSAEAATSEVETTEARVETIEVPSLMHKKEGDRSIGLKDEFVESDVEVSSVKKGWDCAPSVPAEISMEFGKPLEIVKDNLSPISL